MFTKIYGGKNEIMEHGNVWKAGEFEGNHTVNNTKQMDAWQPFSKIKLKLQFLKQKNKTLLLKRDYQDMSFNLKNNRNYKTKCAQSMKVNLSNWNSGTRSALTRIEHFFPVESNVTGIGGCWRLWQLQNNHCRFVATVHRFFLPQFNLLNNGQIFVELWHICECILTI